MMNKTRYTNRLGMVALLCLALGVGILFAGCDELTQATKKPVTKVETKPSTVTVTPVKPPEKQATQNVAAQPAKPVIAAKTTDKQVATAPAADKQAAQVTPTQPAKPEVAKASSSIPEKVEDCENLIQLHEKVAELKEAGTLGTEISAAIDKKHKALLAETKVYHFAGKLDLLAIDFRMIGPEKATIYLLLRPNEKLTSDYKIGMTVKVDKSHVRYLSADADLKSLSEKWTTWPLPRSTEWIPGEEILITTEHNLKAGPYELFVGFYANDPPHRLGDYTRLGWYADLGDE